MDSEINILHFVLGFICGHICGSIPSGLWIVKALFGIDIRNYGSKNIGTTNVFRTVGAKAALLVLILDMLKGIIAVAAMNYFFANPLLDVITALGALLGHNYSVFLRFKGGKGVATGLGLLIYLMPGLADSGPYYSLCIFRFRCCGCYDAYFCMVFWLSAGLYCVWRHCWSFRYYQAQGKH